jgi:hypothetical protein
MIQTLDEMHARRLPLDGQALARTDFDDTYDTDRTVVADLADANLITSIVAASAGDPDGLIHKVVIDVDLPITAIESSTPGHFHLFIDCAMSWPNVPRATGSADDGRHRRARVPRRRAASRTHRGPAAVGPQGRARPATGGRLHSRCRLPDPPGRQRAAQLRSPLVDRRPQDQKTRV